MLRGVLTRISTFNNEVDDLRAQVLSRVASAVEVWAAAAPTQCDSQQHDGEIVCQVVSEMFHVDSIGESDDEEMALDASGEEEDLEMNCGDGIWERRRSGVIKNKRLVKNKESAKATPCKTIFLGGRGTSSTIPSFCGETTCRCACGFVSGGHEQCDWSFIA